MTNLFGLANSLVCLCARVRRILWKFCARARIDRAGARTPYRCEVYPSASSQKSDKQTKLGVLFGDLDKKYDGFPCFSDWFSEWVGGRTVAPDTGIILNHYLTAVLFPRVSHKIWIRIPRLVVLEIEARGNRNEREGKRLAFSAFSELRTLRLCHEAHVFYGELEGPLLSGFSKFSGKNQMDPLIRREIRNETSIADLYATQKAQDKIVLLTRDLMMACSASAEDIDAFYVCTKKPEKMKFEISTKILTNVILEMAVMFGKIRIDGLKENESLILEGMWSGKSIMDWYKKRLMVKVTTSNSVRTKNYDTGG